MGIDEEKKHEVFKVKENWYKQSEALKKTYPKLTNYDVKFETGREIDLISRLKTKLDKDRSEIIQILNKNQEACL
ncbi:hypothetical protein [Pseudofulvibacter geojedonensis]|uniref:General stress protein CsbD n=1 Tax=Pseudofulvibacter geojedonensis TaxID=1123758 RepID=A0ABW3I3A3_9FLAO